MLLPVPFVHRVEIDHLDPRHQIPAVVGNPEAIAAGHQQAGAAGACPERRQDRRQNRAKFVGARLDRWFSCDRRLQHLLLKIVGDQQDRMLPQHALQHILQRQAKRGVTGKDLRCPDVAHALALLRRHRLQDLGQDVERRVSFMQHDRVQMGQPLGHPRRQTGFSEIAHAVEQRRPGVVGAKGADHPLDFLAPAYKFLRRRHRHPVLVGVQEGRANRWTLALRHVSLDQRPAATGAEIDPGEMPVLAARWVAHADFQYRAPGQRGGLGHGFPARQGVIKDLGEVDGIDIRDRAVPAHDIGDPRAGQRCDIGFRDRRNPARVAIAVPVRRVLTTTGSWRRVGNVWRDRRGQAGRYKD